MSTDTLEATLKALPKLLREREEALEEKEKEVTRLEALAEAKLPESLAKAGGSDVLRVNVGGRATLDVLRRTMTQVEGSLLASLFSGRWDESLEKDADGVIFVDQPPNLFFALVDCLRSIANETPRTETTQPPRFGFAASSYADKKLEYDFRTMVEYYGMTLGIYRVGIYKVENQQKYRLVGGGPDYGIDTDEWATFCLLPLEESHDRDMEAFEVTLGSCSAIQIGWLVWSPGFSQTESFFGSENGRGVGYGSYSISLDCVRRGIAYEDFSSFDNDKVSAIGANSVIRTSNRGKEWYLDGKLVASETKHDTDGVLPVLCANNKNDRFNTFRSVPCLSVKGSCHISAIELESKLQ